MADKTGISWTDATWNPIVGCSVVSPGCTNCYAQSQAARVIRCSAGSGRATHYEGTVKPSKAGPVWTGKVALAPDSILTQPLRWRRQRRIFVNSMGDLFHESVPDEWIDRVFAVMALAPQHTFQCLTKRSGRMRDYCSSPSVTQRIAQAMDALQVDIEHDPNERWAEIPGWEVYEASTNGRMRRGGELLAPVLNSLYGRPSITLWKDNEPTTRYVHSCVLTAFRGPAPEGTEARHRNGDRQDNRLANLQWANGSTNQRDKVRHGSNGGPAKLTREQAAEIRALRKSGKTQQSIADQFSVSRSLVSMIESRLVWPDALAWPLPNVWLGVTAEDQPRADERIPDLLATPAALRFVSVEPMLGAVDLKNITPADKYELDALSGFDFDQSSVGPRLDWVIAGGESGPGARPMHPDWVRWLRGQCAAAAVPFFFKQWGEYREVETPAELIADDSERADELFNRAVNPSFIQHDGTHIRSRDDLPWNEDNAARLIERIGTARAGHLLDGREHHEFPGVPNG